MKTRKCSPLLIQAYSDGHTGAKWGIHVWERDDINNSISMESREDKLGENIAFLLSVVRDHAKKDGAK